MWNARDRFLLPLVLLCPRLVISLRTHRIYRNLAPSLAGMVMASMDALGAFSYLLVNLPAWVARVTDLAAHTSGQFVEYSEAYRRHSTYKPSHRNNSSVRPIHTSDLVPIAQREDWTPGIFTTPYNTTRTPFQVIGRKRGADAVPSIDSTERHPFVRTKHKVIIRYDGHTQEVLDEMVQDVRIARNNIRRSQMPRMLRPEYRAGFLNKAVNMGASNQPDRAESLLSGLACVRSTRTRGGAADVSGNTASIGQESPFDFADKQLELAHGLCETAAYQVLRSGACGTELDGVVEIFQMLLEIATNEVKRLKEEKHQAETPPEDSQNRHL